MHFVVDDMFFGSDCCLTDSVAYNFSKRSLLNHLNKNYSVSHASGGFAYGHSESQESFRWSKRGQGLMTPLRIIKYPLNLLKDAQNQKTIELFRLRFNTEPKQVEPKVNPHQTQ